SDSIKERVKQKAKELNYKPNRAAVNLKLGKSNTIGVVVPDVSKNFFASSRSVGSDVTWAGVVDDTLNAFYQMHNFLVYAPIKNGDKSAQDKVKIATFLKSYLGENVSSRMEVSKFGGDETVKVFEVAVKFRFIFRGEPQYVINKFYFKEDLSLCDAGTSRMLFSQIESIAKGSEEKVDANAETQIESSQVSQMTEKIVEIMTSEEGFQNYLVGVAGEQFGIYEQIADDDGIQIDTIYCDRIKLRYIACLTLENRCYEVKNLANGVLLFSAKLDVNNGLTLVCAKCGTTVVENSREVEDGILAKHCSLPQNCQRCNKFICCEKIEKCSVCGQPLCSDCDDDDTVCRWFDNKQNKMIYYHKKCANFCVDTYEYLPKEATRTCDKCGKTYSLKYFSGEVRLCNLCKPICSIKAADEDRPKYARIYRTHKAMLPVYLRLRKGNLCNENLSTILFRVASGKNFKVYMFDKRQIGGNKMFTLKKLK
ncbi:MAG: hypothetical protein RR338_04500, partial [Clostridia bacterium]